MKKFRNISPIIFVDNYVSVYFSWKFQKGKVEKIEEDSLDLISSPSPTVKIQIIGGKFYLR